MKIITKPWGTEHWLETNEYYTGKFLNISAGQETSKQYHKEKHETLFLLSGKAKVLINGIEKIVDAKIDNEEERVFVIPPHTIHKTTALDEDCVFIEFSTSQLSDVIRISDIYKRIE